MFIRTLTWSSLLIATGLLGAYQDESKRTGISKVLRFEDYPAAEVFDGIPARPKIIDSVHRKYRTRIRRGVEKGWGVLNGGVEKKGPNFAGYLIAIQWGCGSGCQAMVFVDARTGDIHDPPLSIGQLRDQRIGLPVFEGGSAEPVYRWNSRLLKMNACPGEPSRLSLDDPCYTYNFLWEGDKWVLLAQTPLALSKKSK